MADNECKGIKKMARVLLNYSVVRQIIIIVIILIIIIIIIIIIMFISYIAQSNM